MGLLFAVEKPLTAAIPTRSPVKLPGPTHTENTSTSLIVRSSCASRACTSDHSFSERFSSAGALIELNNLAPWLTAMLVVSDDVSSARMIGSSVVSARFKPGYVTVSGF